MCEGNTHTNVKKMSVCIYLCNKGELFVGVEVQFVVLLVQGRNINVICSVQTDRTIQLLWTNYVPVYMKPRAGRPLIMHVTFETPTFFPHLWDRLSQFLTRSGTVWRVLQGISREMEPACFGGSAVPRRL